MIKWIAIIIFALIGLLDVLLILGSAELERRRNAESIRTQGRWALTRTRKTNSWPEHWLRCSACGKFRVIKMGEAFPDYCENCGAYMKGADDEDA